MQHRILEITDRWLHVPDKSGVGRRMWIKGKYFYVKGHDMRLLRKCDCCSATHYDYPVEKYRYLGKSQSSMSHKIVTLKTDSWGN